MLKAIEIGGAGEVKNEVLRKRVLKGKTPNTREFIIMLEDEEVALLIYEDWGRPQCFIYEIFVLGDARKRGVGTWIISQAESLAVGLGRTSISLTARSLYQAELSDEDLVSWYLKKGYVRSPVEKYTLEKFLPLTDKIVKQYR